MMAPNPIGLTAFILVLVLTPLHAVQLSELSATNDNRFYPNVIHNYPDGTILVAATATYPYNELKLHPIVSVPNPPPPAKLSETILFARVYPNNQTMIWATAVTTLELGSFGTTIDPQSNLYIVSDRHAILNPPQNAYTIIKYSLTGKRLYEVTNTPPKFPPSSMSTGPRYRVSVIEQGKGKLFHIPSGELIVPASSTTSQGQLRMGILRLNAKTGKVLGFRPVALPKGIIPFSATPYDFGIVYDPRKTVQDYRACFLFQAELNIQTPQNNQRLFLQCTGLKKKKVVTKVIDGAGVSLFRYSFLKMEENPPNRIPSLFVTYERARNFDSNAGRGKSKATHELVLSRLDTSRLENVNWVTGKRDKSKPLVVKLPTPAFPDASVALLSAQHLPKSKSVAVLAATTTRFQNIKQQKKPGDAITVVSAPNAYVFPEVYWAMFFDKNQKLSIRIVDGDPRTKKESKFGIILSDMAFSKNEKCARLFGFLSTETSESGPLYVLNTPNPIISKGAKC